MADEHFTVLLVEDNPGDARLLREELSGAGERSLQIVWTQTLQAGLQQARLGSVDALLLDLNLPDSRGLQTLAAFQSEAPDLPVVVLSGLADEGTAVRAVQHGAQDYLVKGQVTGDLLTRALRYAIERERSEQRIVHLNSVLRAVRSVNQLISRARDREDLLGGICERLSEATDYQAAWIVAYSRGQDPPLFVGAGPNVCAVDPSSLPHLPCLQELTSSPTETIVRHSDSGCGECGLCGLGATLAAVNLRLEYPPRIYGMLTVVMPRHLADNPEELALIEEVGMDAAYALHGLETNQKRLRAEKALRQSERKFRAIFDHVSDAIYISEIGGQMLEANHVTSERLGYNRAELLAMNVSELHTAESAAHIPEHIRELRQRGQAFFDATQCRRDGLEIPVELSCTLIKYGGKVAVLTSARDVTSRRRAEEAQRMATVGQLAAGVAHEFNNVLAGMSARAQVARSLGTTQSTEDLVESVIRLTARGSEIGRNLISFARPGSPCRTAISVEEQVEGALALAHREIENGDVVVVRDYQAQDIPIYADPGQIQQVLVNLIINSCHAMPEGGTLTFHTRYEPSETGPGEVVLSVEDTGVGIAEEHLPHIFEPFFTTKGDYGQSPRPGAGLGLSVSLGLIIAHGGTITMDSQPGAGATCTVRLAAATPEERRQDVAAPTPEQPRPRRERGEGSILLAEDEADIRLAVAMALRQTGFEVIEARSLPEALRALSRQRLKGVVSDLMMPGGDGRKLLELTQHMLAPPPVLFITGKSEANLPERLKEAGAAAVLRKPFDVQELVQRLLEVTS